MCSIIESDYKINKTNISKEKASDKDQEYLNLYFFEIKKSILFTYSYLFACIMLNLVNRKMFRDYNFKFSFILMMCQQLTGIFCFQFLFKSFKNYNKVIGNISITEFFAFKIPIIVFSTVFLLNIYFSFLGNQTVNTQMFLSLRKYLLVFNYLFDLFVNRKNLPSYFGISVLMITFGSTLSAVSDSNFINNIISYYTS